MPKKAPILCFTVTTDLNYDQRMIRICTSLVAAGYQVKLIGRLQKDSAALSKQNFEQFRLPTWFEKGKLFYIEYNIRLFFYLLTLETDLIGAIDLDTIIPVLWVSKLRNKKRVYDAHELFCEMKEIVTRPFIYKCWKWIERNTVPHFKHGYTVNQPIADAFKKMYGVNYALVRNIAALRELPNTSSYPTEKFLLYQGAINEGRCFETLIPAMQWVDLPLYICGDGNFMQQAKELVKQYHLQEKVIFKGKLKPDELRELTAKAFLGFTLFDATGKSNYYSLANRFFDYLHAGIPQICVDFPVYRDFMQPYPFAFLCNDTSAEGLAGCIQQLNNDPACYQSLKENCTKARNLYNWQLEAKQLVAFYHHLLPLPSKLE